MIYDSLDNLNFYAGLHPLFLIVSRYAGSGNIAALPKGKVSIGAGVQAIVDEYATQDFADTFIECHRKYIDIQMIAEGAEQIGICPKKDTEIIAAYDQEKDYEKLSGIIDLLTLKKGYFAIFYPQDGHAPGLKINGKAGRVKKIVFKVPVAASEY